MKDNPTAEEREMEAAQKSVGDIVPEFWGHRLALNKCAPSRFNKGVLLVRNSANEPVGILKKLPRGYVLIDEFGEKRSGEERATPRKRKKS